MKFMSREKRIYWNFKLKCERILLKKCQKAFEYVIRTCYNFRLTILIDRHALFTFNNFSLFLTVVTKHLVSEDN